MLKKLVVVGFVAAACTVVAQMLPDIKRYLKIRCM